MAFLANNAVNRVNLHSGIQALAQNGGGVFLMVFLLRAHVSMPAAFLAFAALFAGRLALRPAMLPLARRWGMKPLLIAGNFGVALTYPVLAGVNGVGFGLLAWCAVSALADILYWPTYNAYIAAVGDPEHRGHQLGARESMVSIAGIVAPLLGAWALVTLGPGPMFAAAGLIQALAAIPLLGAPNVPVKASAPGALRAARLAAALSVADGWFDAFFLVVWQVALYLSLGRSIAAYGGAMALAGLVGAVCGPLLGRHIDGGGARRAVLFAYAGMATILIARAASLDSPWLAVGANAAGALLGTLMLPATTAVSNLAKASPCPYRFHIAAEGGWDVGFAAAALTAAGLSAWKTPLAWMMLLALPALAAAASLLRRYYAGSAGTGVAANAPAKAG